MPGFVTFSLALAGLVFGLIRSQAEGWGSFQVLGSLIAAAVLLIAFIVIELRVREPMLDLGAAARPDLQRRLGRRLGGVGLDLLAAHLSGDLPPGPDGLFGDGRRRALPAADRWGIPGRRASPGRLTTKVQIRC